MCNCVFQFWYFPAWVSLGLGHIWTGVGVGGGRGVWGLWFPSVMPNSLWDFYTLLAQSAIILVLLTSSNLVFGDIEKAIFQVVARHSEIIFNLLNSPNSDLVEVEKAMFQVVARHYIIFCLLTRSKCDMGEFEKAMLQVPHCTFNSFSVSCPAQIAIWVRSRMRCYNWSPGCVRSYSASRTAKNTTW